MTLKARFVAFTLLFLSLMGGFLYYINLETEQLSQQRRKIEEDWSEAKHLFRMQEVVTRIQAIYQLSYNAQVPIDRTVVDLASDLDKELQGLRQISTRLFATDAQRDAALQAILRLDNSLSTLKDFILTAGRPGIVLDRSGMLVTTEWVREISGSIRAYANDEMDELSSILKAIKAGEEQLEMVSRQWMLGMALLLIVGWIGFAVWLLAPLNRLEAMVEQVRGKNFIMHNPRPGTTELDDLMESFVEMAREIQAFTNELEERVASRTRELEHSKEQMRNMLDRLPEAVALVQEDGKVLLANTAYRKLLGEREKSTVGEILQCPPTKQGYRQWTNDSGEVRLLDVKQFPVATHPDKAATELLEYIQDMTQRGQMEAALATSQRLLTIGRLSSGIAHEINNPLTSISAGSEGLLRRIRKGELDIKIFTEYLEMIQEGVFRCKEITGKLLDFSRQRGESSMIVHIEEIVTSTLKLTEHLTTCKQLTMKSKISGDLEVFSNPRALRQVILNLLLNAIEACNQNGTITVDIHNRRQMLVLTVTDDGIGISEEDLKHLFDPFFTSRRDHSGTGLGLFVTQGLVDALGGRIYATSEGPGKGATFTVEFPAMQDLTHTQERLISHG